jgi:type IV pilus assembly protein PilN
MTTSVRINLLPHREQKRQARQRQFVSLAVMVAILGLGIVGLVHFVLATQIESQNNRNALLKTEIVKLDEQIKEIDKLRDQIAQVLSRKQVVETLQSNRNEAVHLLDQLVRQLPDGIYLRSIKQVGTKVTLVGYAQSNARVSTLMRNVEASPWLGQPELVEIKLVAPPAAGRPQQTRGAANVERLNEFTMNLQVKRTAPPAVAVGPATATTGQAAPAPAKGAAPPAKGAAPGKAAPAKASPGAAVKADAGRKGANA